MRESAAALDRVEDTAGLFDLLGVRPQLGRGFTADDGAAPGPVVWTAASLALLAPVLLANFLPARRAAAADPAVALRQE